MSERWDPDTGYDEHDAGPHRDMEPYGSVESARRKAPIIWHKCSDPNTWRPMDIANHLHYMLESKAEVMVNPGLTMKETVQILKSTY